MVLIDRRIGSSDLYPLLRRRQIPAALVTLEYGDAALLGNGPRDTPVGIAVERKRLPDLLASMTSGRLAGHQLRGLNTDYPYRWLVVEGRWQVDTDGIILTWQGKKRPEPLTLGRRRFLERDLQTYLLTLELRGGMRIRKTDDAEGTAEFLTALYTWWVKKSFDAHRGHLALYDPLHEADSAVLTAPTLVRHWAKALPGIGYDKSAAVAARFKTGLELALADEVEWRQIEGIGQGISVNVVKMIRGDQS